jgi:hypothetical protein
MISSAPCTFGFGIGISETSRIGAPQSGQLAQGGTCSDDVIWAGMVMLPLASDHIGMKIHTRNPILPRCGILATELMPLTFIGEPSSLPYRCIAGGLPPG